MRVGVLSLVLSTNYGGILQSYALQKILNQIGHDVVILDKNRDISRPFLIQLLSYLKYCFSRIFLGRKSVYKSPKTINSEMHQREIYTREFINKYLSIRLINKLEHGILDDVDAIIVGSDQVWRPRYFKKKWDTTMGNAFLEFHNRPSTKRIAYAASFGTDEWEFDEEETRRCAQLLQGFSAVSVREKSGIDLCDRFLGYSKAKHVLDPTMLLSEQDYVSIIKRSIVPKSKGNLMCYILDMTDDKKELINRISRERGLVPFYSNSRVSDINAPHSERIQPPVESWLRGFMDAEFVVTDSFHACVFSIIFRKPFVVIGNKERGMSRFDSLLSMFYLCDHLLLTPNDYVSSKSYAINDEVYNELEILRKQSKEFIISSLS